ncbi:MAG: type II secretion system protein [Silvanigrellales bacterium]|nr:type II secretion system protein [Silvanigrellales bacterium]
MTLFFGFFARLKEFLWNQRACSRSAPSQRGVSLVELMVSTTILGLVTAASVSTFRHYSRTSESLELANLVSGLKRSMEADLRNPRNLSASLGAAGNGGFAQCFGRIAGAVCNQTLADTYYPFVLVSPPSVTLSGGTGVLSGQAQTAARRVLTAEGQTCPAAQVAAADPRCEVEVTTAFRAVCPAAVAGAVPAATCSAPQSVELFYVIRQLNTGRSFVRNMRFPITSNMVDQNGQAKNRVDAIRVVVSEFSRPTVFTCPTGLAFQGFDVGGNPLCGRVDNPCAAAGMQGWMFVSMNPDGTPNCRKPLQGESCPNGPGGAPLTLRGVLPNGTLDCVAPRVVNQGCPNGQVLVRFDGAGNPVCNVSHVGTGCPVNTYLVGYNGAGAPNCATMLTPSSPPFEVAGPQCGHNMAGCAYGSGNKPPGYSPGCPAGSIKIGEYYRGPRCCATCGWVGQWWCDDIVAQCSYATNARWN